MVQRISVLTIAAENVDAMKNFYSNILGWTQVTGNKDIIFYKLNGFLLSICNRKLLADFIGIGMDHKNSHTITIGYNVETKEEVLQLYAALKDKVKIIKEPTEPPFGGLFFYFQDVEENILEVACNPFVTLDSNRNVTNHQSIDNL